MSFEEWFEKHHGDTDYWWLSGAMEECWTHQQSKIDKLQTKLEVARKCIEFYAKPTWVSTVVDNGMTANETLRKLQEEE